MLFVTQHAGFCAVLCKCLKLNERAPRAIVRHYLPASPAWCVRAQVAAYLGRVFGGAEAARAAICADFFRHAFDGSGADNFFDAGSCIDGRLTSAWHWCSKLDTKPYYVVFKMAGFSGFDGDFR